MSMQLHTRAFLTNFEMACEFGILITAADVVWLLHDILTNGVSLSYILIGILLLIGLIGLVYVIYRHHLHYTHRLIQRIINRRAKKGVL